MEQFFDNNICVGWSMFKDNFFFLKLFLAHVDIQWWSRTILVSFILFFVGTALEKKNCCYFFSTKIFTFGVLISTFGHSIRRTLPLWVVNVCFNVFAMHLRDDAQLFVEHMCKKKLFVTSHIWSYAHFVILCGTIPMNFKLNCIEIDSTTGN